MARRWLADRLADYIQEHPFWMMGTGVLLVVALFVLTEVTFPSPKPHPASWGIILLFLVTSLVLFLWRRSK